MVRSISLAPFSMRADKVGEDSSIQRMIRLVQSADAGKAKIVTMADRWATWIVVIALTAALGTWLVTGEVIRGVTILVVFCPCALVLATPTAIMAAIGNATKHGFLVREGDALERLAQVKQVAFDKTGTLTFGHPQVKAVECWEEGLTRRELYCLAAAAELRSEHPLGKAVVAGYRQEVSAEEGGYRRCQAAGAQSLRYAARPRCFDPFAPGTGDSRQQRAFGRTADYPSFGSSGGSYGIRGSRLYHNFFGKGRKLLRLFGLGRSAAS